VRFQRKGKGHATKDLLRAPIDGCVPLQVFGVASDPGYNRLRRRGGGAGAPLLPRGEDVVQRSRGPMKEAGLEARKVRYV
jgi:hypothetical protein